METNRKTKSKTKTEVEYRKELLKNEGYWIADWQLKLYEEISNYLKDNNLKSYQFAEQIGVGKSYISQILNGNFNYKISTLIKLSLAIGKIPKLNFIEIEKYIENDSLGIYNLPEVEQNIVISITSDVNRNSGDEICLTSSSTIVFNK